MSNDAIHQIIRYDNIIKLTDNLRKAIDLDALCQSFLKLWPLISGIKLYSFAIYHHTDNQLYIFRNKKLEKHVADPATIEQLLKVPAACKCSNRETPNALLDIFYPGVSNIHGEVYPRPLKSVNITLIYSLAATEAAFNRLDLKFAQLAFAALEQGLLSHFQEHLLALQKERENYLKEVLALNTQLVEAERAAQEEKQKAIHANKMKSEFLANMSHELRTPLNSLLILAQELTENEDGNLTDGQVQDASIIYHSGKDLLTLINDILDISKIEAGKMQVRFNSTDIAEMMGNLEKIFRPIADKKALSFHVDIAPDTVQTLETDAIRLEQILKNFLSNAFKFTEKGGVTVKIFTPDARDITASMPDESAAPAIAFSVTDSGIGIAEENLGLVFEAFRQADGSISRKYGGTGLGLSISNNLAQALGGFVQLTSKEGEGSTFTLYLPLTPPQADAKETDSNNESAYFKPAKTTKKPLTTIVDVQDDREQLADGDDIILVVDDDTAFTKILRKKIHEAGCKCLIAHNGKAGLQLAQEYLPKAIILDVGLSDISGIEVHKRLSDTVETRDIPVLFMTAHDSIPSFAAAESIGLLTKPVTTKQLERAFNAIAASIHGTVKHILIVEDDDNLRHALETAAKKFKITVDSVSTSEEALQILETIAPDTMLLDLMLPGMDGLNLLETVANNPQIAKPRVIIYSGKDLTDDEKRKIDKYAESYIKKSGKPTEEILASIRELHIQRPRGMATVLPIDGTKADSSSASSKSEADAQESLAEPDSANHLLSAKKVLIVDDDSRNIFVLSRLLNKTGAEIYTAQDGQQAIDFLKKNTDTTIVFMDVMMPVMDGLTAILELRKMEHFKTLPIVSVTAKAMREDETICLDAGASAYLSKPVDRKLLFETIDKLIAA